MPARRHLLSPRAAIWTSVLIVTVGGGLVLSRSQGASSRGRLVLPIRDDIVVEKLPRSASDPRVLEARRLRRQLAIAPRTEALAARLARLEIEDARRTSDPRHLGYAQAALMPWWSDADAPPQISLLRATIRQSRHQFGPALVDLDRVAVATPSDPQVWLTRSVVLSVVGRYAEAAESCAPLERLASALVFAVCTASVRGVTGQVHDAAAELTRALVVPSPDGDPTRPWALSVLAELTAWAGDRSEAERLSRQALALDAEDSYTRAELADLLLAEGRPTEVPALLRGREQNDGLLLRLAIAEHMTGAGAADADAREVADRFEAARLRGDALHGREEARFELFVRHDAARALSLARANWEVQHEPADALILLQAAAAAHDAQAAGPAVRWARETGFEGPEVKALGARLARGP